MEQQIDINKVLESAAGIALDEVPSSGSQYKENILEVFNKNPAKFLTGKILSKIFAQYNIELSNISGVLAALCKEGQIEKVKAGVYRKA